jgi:hypothetical protein
MDRVPKIAILASGVNRRRLGERARRPTADAREREPRISASVCKYNAWPFRYQASQQLFGPNALYTGIRNTHELNRMILDPEAPAFVIKDGNGVRAQCVRNFLRPVEVIMIS